MTTPSVCRCESESAELLPTAPQPDRVITLVHGTFAQHAPWTREGPLWDKLNDTKNLSGSTLFQRFCLSGNNSHSARLTAGEAHSGIYTDPMVIGSSRGSEQTPKRSQRMSHIPSFM